MAQLVVSAVSAAAGFALGGPTGAQVGWALGSALYASSQTVSNVGPRSTDLKSPKLQYGAQIPRLYGRMRVAGIPVWMSDKRAIANTTSEGGKGGPTVESTTYTYEVDALYMVAAESDVIAITRVWINGKVVYVALADADAETHEASASTEAWAEMLLHDGNPAQMPWPIYEAAVETENALAYRRRTTISIEALNLGGSDQIPLVEFEVITAGTEAEIDASVLFQACFRENSLDDESSFERATTLGTNAISIGDELVCEGPNPLGSGNGYQASIPVLAGAPWTFEFRSDWSTLPAGGDSVNLFAWGVGGSGLVSVFAFKSGLDFRLLIQSTSTGDRVITGVGSGEKHLCLEHEAGVIRVSINGLMVDEFNYGASASHVGGLMHVLGYASEFTTYAVTIDDIRITDYARYEMADFTPPESPLPSAIGPITVWTPDSVDLADIVESECNLAGLVSAKIDVSDLVGVGATGGIEVTGFAAVGSARQSIEVLMAGYYFEACCSDKLYFRPRGRAIAATISYEELAAGVDQASATAFDPVRANLEELPAQVAVGFMNISADYEAGSEMGDRLVGPGKLVQRADLALAMTPAEAKGRALAYVMDALAAGGTAQISLTDEYSELEPTDAIAVTDRDGTVRRMRIVRESYAQLVKQLSIVGDDPSALVTTGLTMDESVPVIVVTPPADTAAVYLDIPLLADVYDTPGFFAAMSGGAGWPGAALFRSLDDVSYTQVATATQKATYGSATELGDWTEGHKYDERNTIAVTLAQGTLSSSTRDAMAADRTVNVAAIGAPGRWEIVRFRSASLLAPGQYLLSGFLRGELGTEWATGTHQLGDQFVILNTAIRKIDHSVSDIGLARYLKAVTLGRALGTADSQEFTDSGVLLKPYSPVDARASRSGDDITITWRRRTRRQTRYFGPMPASVPLGEETELYSIDIIDGSSGVIGTVASTSPSVTFDATDYGLTPGDPVEVAIHQISASVGRGYALEATV